MASQEVDRRSVHAVLVSCKRLSNDEWVSRTDPEARIARMEDGTTHLAVGSDRP